MTTRGGVWHTGQLIATILTLACLIELWGSRRAWLIGLLAGAAFLTRAPLAFAVPFYALLLAGDRDLGAAALAVAGVGALAAGVAAVDRVLLLVQRRPVRVAARVGLRPGDAARWLEAQRQQGLFSLAHVPMNLDYLFLHLPTLIADVPVLPARRPRDVDPPHEPGAALAVRAPWRASRAWWLAGAALLVLIPTLLYYGGGWLQYGYRYVLDSIPFVLALCALAAARDEGLREVVGLGGAGIGVGWRLLILFGLVVGLGGVYWAYHL